MKIQLNPQTNEYELKGKRLDLIFTNPSKQKVEEYYIKQVIKKENLNTDEFSLSHDEENIINGVYIVDNTHPLGWQSHDKNYIKTHENEFELDYAILLAADGGGGKEKIEKFITSFNAENSEKQIFQNLTNFEIKEAILQRLEQSQIIFDGSEFDQEKVREIILLKNDPETQLKEIQEFCKDENTQHDTDSEFIITNFKQAHNLFQYCIENETNSKYQLEFYNNAKELIKTVEEDTSIEISFEDFQNAQKFTVNKLQTNFRNRKFEILKKLGIDYNNGQTWNYLANYHIELTKDNTRAENIIGQSLFGIEDNLEPIETMVLKIKNSSQFQNTNFAKNQVGHQNYPTHDPEYGKYHVDNITLSEPARENPSSSWQEVYHNDVKIGELNTKLVNNESKETYQFLHDKKHSHLFNNVSQSEDKKLSFAQFDSVEKLVEARTILDKAILIEATPPQTDEELVATLNAYNKANEPKPNTNHSIKQI